MFENVSEIILKVTRDCNLRCQYCYIKDKDKYSKEEMSEEVYQTLINRIVRDKARNVLNNYNKSLNIVFHGGEPTLLGVAKLQKFVDYARQAIPQSSFGIQTNMTKFNSDWMMFFKKNNIIPGVSIDGFDDEDNRLRTEQIALKEKLDYLKKEKVGYGALMIITKNNVKKFYKNVLKLIEHSGNKYIKANFAENTYSQAAGAPEVSPQELYQYVFLPAFDHFLKQGVFIEENVMFFIDKFVKSLVFKQRQIKDYSCYANCLAKFCGGGNSVVEVDPDGNVCFCGRWSDVNELNVLGNYLQAKNDFFGLNSLNNILKIHLEKIKDIRKKRCDFCNAADICTFGCIAFSYDKYGEVKMREDLVCNYVKLVKNTLNMNKYQVIYNYVKANNWEIKAVDRYYYLNIPLFDNKYDYQDIFDDDIKWITEVDNKIYFRIPKKYVDTEVSVA